MSVVSIPWASWLATLLGSAVAAILAFALDRYFSDTQAALLGPIAWLLGGFLGATITTLLLSAISSWYSSASLVTIIETSWLQKALILIAPVFGIVGSRVGLRPPTTPTVVR